MIPRPPGAGPKRTGTAPDPAARNFGGFFRVNGQTVVFFVYF
jgi:hypothetical protein